MPALPLQEFLLSESLQKPQCYWSHKFFSLDPEIDLSKLERSWKQVAQDIDALRTAFLPVAKLKERPCANAIFLQLIYTDMEPSYSVGQCKETPFEDRAKTCAEKIVERHQQRHFVEPPWAATVFTQETFNVMMFSLHHSIQDEPSLNFIMAELKQAYLSAADKSFRRRHQLREATSLLLSEYDQAEQTERY